MLWRKQTEQPMNIVSCYTIPSDQAITRAIGVAGPSLGKAMASIDSSQTTLMTTLGTT
jgi:hypothetical protein